MVRWTSVGNDAEFMTYAHKIAEKPLGGFSPWRDGVELVEYFIDDMGHVWPGGINRLPVRLVGKPSDKLSATDAIWSFFKAHPKQR